MISPTDASNISSAQLTSPSTISIVNSVPIPGIFPTSLSGSLCLTSREWKRIELVDQIVNWLIRKLPEGSFQKDLLKSMCSITPLFPYFVISNMERITEDEHNLINIIQTLGPEMVENLKILAMNGSRSMKNILMLGSCSSPNIRDKALKKIAARLTKNGNLHNSLQIAEKISNSLIRDGALKEITEIAIRTENRDRIFEILGKVSDQNIYNEYVERIPALLAKENRTNDALANLERINPSEQKDRMAAYLSMQLYENGDVEKAIDIAKLISIENVLERNTTFDHLVKKLLEIGCFEKVYDAVKEMTPSSYRDHYLWKIALKFLEGHQYKEVLEIVERDVLTLSSKDEYFINIIHELLRRENPDIALQTAEKISIRSKDKGYKIIAKWKAKKEDFEGAFELVNKIANLELSTILTIEFLERKGDLNSALSQASELDTPLKQKAFMSIIKYLLEQDCIKEINQMIMQYLHEFKSVSALIRHIASVFVRRNDVISLVEIVEGGIDSEEEKNGLYGDIARKAAEKWNLNVAHEIAEKISFGTIRNDTLRYISKCWKKSDNCIRAFEIAKLISNRDKVWHKNALKICLKFLEKNDFVNALNVASSMTNKVMDDKETNYFKVMAFSRVCNKYIENNQLSEAMNVIDESDFPRKSICFSRMCIALCKYQQKISDVFTIIDKRIPSDFEKIETIQQVSFELAKRQKIRQLLELSQLICEFIRNDRVKKEGLLRISYGLVRNSNEIDVFWP